MFFFSMLVPKCKKANAVYKINEIKYGAFVYTIQNIKTECVCVVIVAWEGEKHKTTISNACIGKQDQDDDVVLGRPP